jgi:rhodanese-related sulfurtransferase
VAAWSKAAAHAGADPTVWLMCGSGFRAMVAASLLAREGVPVVVVDDMFGNAATSGVQLVSEQHHAVLAEAYAD